MLMLIFLIWKKNNKTVSKSLIYGAYEAIPCAPKISVFGTVGAHDAWSCAFSVFEISDFGTHPPHGKIAPIEDIDHKRQAVLDNNAPTLHNFQAATKHPAGRNASRPQALVSLWSLIFNVGYSMSKVKGQRKQVNVKKWIFFMKCEG